MKRTLVYAIPFYDETSPMRAPYQLCKGFLDRDWSVRIETITRIENIRIFNAWGKVPIQKINGTNKIHKMTNYVINFFRRREKEVVVSWIWYWHCFSLLLSKILFKNPYVIVLDSYTYMAPWDHTGRLSKIRIFLRYGLILKYADIVIAETLLSFDHAKQHTKNPRILLIPICFWKKDLDEIKRDWSITNFCPKRQPFILFTGQITDRKNIHHLIEAFIRLSVSFPEWKLEIRGPVSSPIYLVSLKNLVSQSGMAERISFLPSLYGDTLYKRYRSSSIYCLPSSYEGVPTTILEAMYFGGAIVAADSGHIKYQLDDGNCGLLFTPGNIDQLTDHLRILMKSERKRDYLMMKSRNRVQELFIWEKYFDQLEEYMKALIE